MIFAEAIAISALIFGVLYLTHLDTKYGITIPYIDMVYMVFILKLITNNFIAFISTLKNNTTEEILEKYNEIQKN